MSLVHDVQLPPMQEAPRLQSVSATQPGNSIDEELLDATMHRMHGNCESVTHVIPLSPQNALPPSWHSVPVQALARGLADDVDAEHDALHCGRVNPQFGDPKQEPPMQQYPLTVSNAVLLDDESAMCSSLHNAEHPSPLTLLPSSHSSDGSMTASPQRAGLQLVLHVAPGVLEFCGPSSHCSLKLTTPSPQ